MYRKLQIARLACLGVALLILIPATPKHIKSADSTVSAIKGFIDRGLAGTNLGSIVKIRQLFGAPLRTETRNVMNRHYPGVIDKIHTLFYDGLAIKIYDASLTGREFVIAIALNRPQYRLENGLRIGASRQALLETLGYPTYIHKSLLIYDEMLSGNGRVCFRLEKGKVTGILWEYYFD